MSQSPNDPKRSAIGAGVTPERSPSWPTPCSLPPRTNAKSSTRSSSSRPGARPRSASGHAGERAAHPHPRRTRGPARTPALARRDAVGPQSHRHHQRRTQSAANPSSPSTSPSASPQASPPCDTSPPVAPDPSCCSPPRTLTTSCAHASRPSPAPPPTPLPDPEREPLGTRISRLVSLLHSRVMWQDAHLFAQRVPRPAASAYYTDRVGGIGDEE